MKNELESEYENLWINVTVCVDQNDVFDINTTILCKDETEYIKPPNFIHESEVKIAMEKLNDIITIT